ncbi:hypothetical protein HPODL_05221 [Ogataea parapolymorpha DL-1]|uniref:60S acidic ribosomal protein P2 n=1 Tax=Ogataea parapolymorpha (strain ATCC 26012 / BCRC 20466 / JCM 22074 / NRRL Y-7560 / DL-1) TaxID=871575 RepID=W1QFP7_OGAPD|nr:hypothetical protein HPODL_05221 [Ogataea parapolymorpha DL-1]ESW99842.1 hypothetical protein HPODL_05221 [Ogataea parapolymorpha DL-1]
MRTSCAGPENFPVRCKVSTRNIEEIRHLQHSTKMKYIAAYLLLVQAGNTAPSAADVTKVLESVGVEVESEKLDKLIAEVEGKSVEELISEGTEKMSSVPTGAPAAAAGASGAAAGASEAAAEEAAAEEEEEEDDDMGFGLFD